MRQGDLHELPLIPRHHLTLDTGAVVPPDHGLLFWWTVDDFVESRRSWVPPAPLRIRRFPIPGVPGYMH